MISTHDALTWLLASLAGMALGAFFFGGLWWTVRRTLRTGPSVLCNLGGLLLRNGVTLAGFYVVGAQQWERFTACLLGFVIARAVIVRMTQTWVARQARPMQEVSHATQS